VRFDKPVLAHEPHDAKYISHGAFSRGETHGKLGPLSPTFPFRAGESRGFSPISFHFLGFFGDASAAYTWCPFDQLFPTVQKYILSFPFFSFTTQGADRIELDFSPAKPGLMILPFFCQGWKASSLAKAERQIPKPAQRHAAILTQLAFMYRYGMRNVAPASKEFQLLGALRAGRRSPIMESLN
jgi:hypothetical protein